MKTVYDKTACLGDYRVLVKDKEPSLPSYEAAEIRARNVCRDKPGAQVEILQVVGVFKGAVEVFKVEGME